MTVPRFNCYGYQRMDDERFSIYAFEDEACKKLHAELMGATNGDDLADELDMLPETESEAVQLRGFCHAHCNGENSATPRLEPYFQRYIDANWEREARKLADAAAEYAAQCAYDEIAESRR